MRDQRSPRIAARDRHRRDFAPRRRPILIVLLLARPSSYFVRRDIPEMRVPGGGEVDVLSGFVKAKQRRPPLKDAKRKPLMPCPPERRRPRSPALHVPEQHGAVMRQ